MVTAGHCNSNGRSTNMGTAYREAAAYPYYDFELITGRTYQGQIYDTGSTGRWVLNGSNPSVGSSYCVTGRNSGFHCGWVVRKLNQTICYDPLHGPCYHGLAEFYGTSGVSVVQLGDLAARSGTRTDRRSAPVFVASSQAARTMQSRYGVATPRNTSSSPTTTSDTRQPARGP